MGRKRKEFHQVNFNCTLENYEQIKDMKNRSEWINGLITEALEREKKKLEEWNKRQGELFPEV
jgi:metal-responsive CopG/Arc/MetJ family transcriptional regulator